MVINTSFKLSIFNLFVFGNSGQQLFAVYAQVLHALVPERMQHFYGQ